MVVKTCYHGNVNIDEHVITTTLKYSQIILKEKSPRFGGHTCSLNGFEVTHFFSELSPGLNRVNTAAWVMIFTIIK